MNFSLFTKMLACNQQNFNNSQVLTIKIFKLLCTNNKNGTRKWEFHSLKSQIFAKINYNCVKLPVYFVSSIHISFMLWLESNKCLFFMLLTCGLILLVNWTQTSMSKSIMGPPNCLPLHLVVAHRFTCACVVLLSPDTRKDSTK